MRNLINSIKSFFSRITLVEWMIVVVILVAIPYLIYDGAWTSNNCQVTDKSRIVTDYTYIDGKAYPDISTEFYYNCNDGSTRWR